MPERRSPRALAAAVLDRALAERLPLDGLLRAAGGGLDERDRALLRTLVLGVMRWLRRLDAVLAAASSRPLSRIDPNLLAPLRIALFELLHLDRVPAHAAVDEAVGEARRRSHRGAAGFVNAVLRRVAATPSLAAWPVEEADPLRRLAVETSYPDFLVRRWRERFGAAAARELLAAGNRRKPLQLLAFRDRGGREALAAALAAEGVETEPAELSPLALTVRRGDPTATAAFRAGDLYLQDEASQAAALLPPPAAGETVLDAAAAPGGKSFALVAWQPAVRPFLADRSLARQLTTRANLRRLGRALPLWVDDARRSGCRGGFARVVADLPCSGTGTLRRHPELKWRLSEERISRLAERGLAILGGLAPRVAPGGRLAVITCSLEREENEGVVERFLTAHPEFGRDPAAGAEDGRWRVLTAGDHDGFTVHLLRRAGAQRT